MAVVRKLRQDRIGEVDRRQIVSNVAPDATIAATPTLATDGKRSGSSSSSSAASSVGGGSGSGGGGSGGGARRHGSSGTVTTGDGDGDDDEELLDEDDEVYDIVDAVVPRTDDPTLPVLTFRVWVLGTVFGILLSTVNTLFTFRTNTFNVSPIIAVLLAYPMGCTMAFAIPRSTRILGISLNPGPFNLKEHALIYVFASSCALPAYALYNIIGQKYQLYHEDLNIFSCIIFGIVTQCFGYGLAGLCRRFLVRPAAMLWPANLSTIALLNSLHSVNDSLNRQWDAQNSLKVRADLVSYTSRFRFFWLAMLGMFVWEWVPGYFAPIASALSLLCWVAPLTPNPNVARVLGSGTKGLGMLSITLDWSLVTFFAPITTPLWALFNQFLGLWFFAWIVTPALWVRSAYGKDFQLGANPGDGPNGTGRYPMGHAMNTADLFDKNGRFVDAASFVNKTTLTLLDDVYNNAAPIYISTWFAVIYVASFVTFVSCLVHVWLWYGRDIIHRIRTSMHDLDRRDVHAQMMDMYPEVPDLWYTLLLSVTLALGIVVCQWGGFQLPWWGVLLGVIFALVSMVPIGVIQAISGQQIALNVMSEFLIGVILPGRIAGVMAFKTFSYMAMYQGLLLVSDLKLGHYLKIPPRNMFTVQLFATTMSVIISIFTSFFIFEAFGRTTNHVDPTDPSSPLKWRLLDDNPPAGWTANSYTVFISAGAIWGAIGPARFFGLQTSYATSFFGFLAGALLPIVPYTLHRAYPKGYWHLVNIPVLTAISLNPGESLSSLVTPLVVGVAVNYFAKKYRHAWWKRNAFVMAAAFDAGTAVALTIIFFAFTVRNENGSSTTVTNDTGTSSASGAGSAAAAVSAGAGGYTVMTTAGHRTLFPFYILNRYDPELCTPEYFQICSERIAAGLYDSDEYCKSIGFGQMQD
ncbi:OPT oligopeptide transporter protein-domain-containing protein [Zopfochytrium polystomum]|nr:OPT oligopeptide transporter protein-domain-containing protein [Zopfochytrium polystomum]